MVPGLTDLLAPGEPVLVGLSGGVDSIVLLHALQRAGHPVAAAHLDHAWRPDSAADAAWVAARCREWAIPLFTERQAVAAGEEAAREARLAYLSKMALEQGFNAVALGHHADDQAETLLFRLARGTGPDGLGGMAPERGLVPGVRLVRPMLALTRVQIMDLAEAWGLSWREDPTNQEVRYARNRIRRDVLPALRELNPAAVANIAALAGIQREETAARQERAARLAKFLVHGIAPGVVEVDRRALAALPPAEARWVLRAVMTAQGTPLEAAALARALATAGDGGARDLGAGWRATAQATWLVLEGPAAGPAPRPYAGPGQQETEDWGWDVTARTGTSERAASPACVRFDLAALPGPLAWRSAEPDDDTFHPWGAAAPMGLRAFLTRQGIPRHRQASLLVLAAGATIAWLVGVRRGALAPAGKQAAEVVEMQARASFQV